MEIKSTSYEQFDTLFAIFNDLVYNIRLEKRGFCEKESVNDSW